MGISNRAKNFLDALREKFTIDDAKEHLSPKYENIPITLRTITRSSPSMIERIWRQLLKLGVTAEAKTELADPFTIQSAENYQANIENMIGTVKIPVGVIGPLRVNGLHANGDYLIPLATTEAALVASYNRGAKAVNKAGGVTVTTLANTVLRSPVFRFENILQSGLFIEWLTRQEEELIKAAQSTTSHGKLITLTPMIDAELVYILCGFSTGDASGQNMVTFASEAMCQYILEHCPIKPISWFLEGNLSGDKKASFLSVMKGRGRKATAQVELSHTIVESVLGVSVEQFLEYVRIANLGALMSGQIGAQAHYANGLAALFLATGQDVACVSETSIGFTRAEETENGLKFTVTLPNLIVGTVGGGTGLPSQKAGLELMGLKGSGHANAFAEVAAGLILCGELSLTAAVAGGQFGMAHMRLARGRKTNASTRS